MLEFRIRIKILALFPSQRPQTDQRDLQASISIPAMSATPSCRSSSQCLLSRAWISAGVHAILHGQEYTLASDSDKCLAVAGITTARKMWLISAAPCKCKQEHRSNHVKLQVALSETHFKSIWWRSNSGLICLAVESNLSQKLRSLYMCDKLLRDDTLLKCWIHNKDWFIHFLIMSWHLAAC